MSPIDLARARVNTFAMIWTLFTNPHARSLPWPE
jgi:hypothetical protein